MRERDPTDERAGKDIEVRRELEEREREVIPSTVSSPSREEREVEEREREPMFFTPDRGEREETEDLLSTTIPAIVSHSNLPTRSTKSSSNRYKVSVQRGSLFPVFFR